MALNSDFRSDWRFFDPINGDVTDGHELATVTGQLVERVPMRDVRRYVLPSSEVVVSDPDQLTGDLRSDVVYQIDGTVDMGARQIKVPQNGPTIRGLDFGVSNLITSENNHTLFVNPDAGYAGNLLMRDLTVTVSGVGSQVFDLDNQGNGGAVECTDFNFFNCTSLGELTAYRQGLWSNFALIACDDGLTMSGTWSGGFAVLTSIIVAAGVTFNGTMLKAGTALVVNGSIRSNINALQLGDGGAISDFAPSNIANDAEFRMIGVRCNPNATPFPNFQASSTKARFSGCVGFRNTYVGAQWAVTTEATTTISATNTPVKVAGVTTYADENWFTHTVDNAFVYNGSDVIGATIFCNLSFTGGNNDQINVILRQWDDSASSYTDLATSGPFTMNAAGRAENISVHAFSDFSQNDRLEVWVENQTDTDNVTMKLGGIVSINERPS